MISAKGRYALQVMIDLAEHKREEYLPLKDIAERQELSLPFLARIMSELSKSGLVEAVQGKGGGYKLTRAPENYTVGEILRLTDESFAPVSCVSPDSVKCEKSSECRTYTMWEKAYEMLSNYFDGITLRDLMKCE